MVAIAPRIMSSHWASPTMTKMIRSIRRPSIKRLPPPQTSNEHYSNWIMRVRCRWPINCGMRPTNMRTFPIVKKASKNHRIRIQHRRHRINRRRRVSADHRGDWNSMPEVRYAYTLTAITYGYQTHIFLYIFALVELGSLLSRWAALVPPNAISLNIFRHCATAAGVRNSNWK